MWIHKRMTAAVELVLLFPAALFMTALLVRQFEPPQYGPALFAQTIITWYAGRIWTLWVLLMLLPLAVLSIGCVEVWRNVAAGTHTRWAAGALRAAVGSQPATMITAGASVAAALILAVVALHVLMN